MPASFNTRKVPPVERISTPRAGQRPGKFDDPRLVGDAEESTFNTRVTGHGSFIMSVPWNVYATGDISTAGVRSGSRHCGGKQSSGSRCGHAHGVRRGARAGGARAILRSGSGQADGAGAASAQDHLRGAELSRSRGGIEVGDPQSPHHFQQVFERGDRPGRSDRAAESIAQAGLRGGIRFRDRPRRPPYSGREGAGSCAGIHHRQRRQRARFSDRHHAVADGQDVRYLLLPWAPGS